MLHATFNNISVISWRSICTGLLIVLLYLYRCWRSNYPRGRILIILTSFFLFQARYCISSTICCILFCVPWLKVRDGCWYWWNCWPSLFKLSLHHLLVNRTSLWSILITIKNIPVSIISRQSVLLMEVKWWLLNAKWAIFQPYYGQNKLHPMRWCPFCTRPTRLIGSS